MSANVETMMYAGRTPWHGDGVYVGEENVYSAEAMVKSDLTWKAHKNPLFAYVDGEPILVEDRVALVRDSDNSVLSVVSPKYEVYQPDQCFAFMDSLVAEGLMRYHTAGSLNGGKQIWMLAKVGDQEIVPGDKVDNFLFLHNGFDGKNSLRILETDVRVVCQNTARAALSKGGGISIRHRGSLEAKVAEAREILFESREQFDKSANFYRELAEVPMTSSDWIDLCLEVFPEPVDVDGKTSSRAKSIVNEKRVTLTNLFLDGTGSEIPGVRGTAWGAYNALTEYASFYRGPKNNPANTRFNTLLIGAGNDFVQRGTNVLQQMVS